jgi:hypothetical protein
MAGSGSVGVGAEVHIAGEGCRLTLRLTRWESSELTSGQDANWVVGDVELVAGTTGRFSARHPVSIRTDEVARFRDELASLLETLTGEATLEHLEDQFGAKVTLKAGAGELEAFVAENVGAQFRVKDVRTDQSYMAETLRELNAAVAAFGVRGSAYD